MTLTRLIHTVTSLVPVSLSCYIHVYVLMYIHTLYIHAHVITYIHGYVYTLHTYIHT